MLLAAVVETSRRVTETTKRLEKMDLLARLLRELQPEEIEIVVPFLAGSIRQGRIGIGYAALRDAQGPAAATASLEIAEVDRTFQSVIAASGSGSQRQRLELLHQMFLRATEAEQQFLVRLLMGELRQGALEAVMVEALAKASGVSGGTCPPCRDAGGRHRSGSAGAFGTRRARAGAVRCPTLSTAAADAGRIRRRRQ